LKGRIANNNSNSTLLASIQGDVTRDDFYNPTSPVSSRISEWFIDVDRTGFFEVKLTPQHDDGYEPNEAFQLKLSIRDNSVEKKQQIVSIFDLTIIDSRWGSAQKPVDPLDEYKRKGIAVADIKNDIDNLNNLSSVYQGNHDAYNNPSYSFPDIAISTDAWTSQIRVRSVFKAKLESRIDYEAPQIDFAKTQQGSIVIGSNKNDKLSGKAGWDIISGGHGDDMIRGGNGRDVISGGLGSDELHGDFGLNTFMNEEDGFSDLIAIKSDQYLSNWLYGKAGNNPNGEKADVIKSLDANDQIKIIGVFTPDISVRAGATAHGVSGIGIYAGGALEALYTGTNLSVAQITAMTSGDGSAAAMANQVSSYGWTGV